ncbi:MAG: hypothetical protein Q4A13_06720 [Fretibacterium sp.]|nr:hypothetical protein [Fretibacterium sp.]
MTAEAGLFAYVTRVLLALGVLSICAVVLVRFSRRRGGSGGSGASVKVLASLPLGRDVFFVVRCGPDVLAFTSGGGGARLMGRWKYEEWVGSNEEPSPRQEG